MSAESHIPYDERRLMAITTIGIETRALVFDEDTEEVLQTNDPAAERLFYVKAFQAWVDGKFKGTAEEIFDAVQEALDIV